MSLITSRTAGSATSSYFLQNVGSDAAPTVPTSSAGVVLIDSVAGAASIRSDGASLSLGGTPSTAPLSITAANVSSSVLVNAASLNVIGATQLLGSVDMSQTAPVLRTYTQPGVAVADGGAGTALPQPASLPTGLYAVSIACNATPAANLGFNAYWNGTQWTSGGSANSNPIGGATNFRVNPVAATLTYFQNSGAPLTINFIYYTQLSAAFP